MTAWLNQLLAFALIGLTACAHGGAPAASTPQATASSTRGTASTSTAVRHNRSTTTSAPRSVAASTPPPPLLNTGRDYVRILQSLLRYSYWIEEHPDRLLLQNVAASRSTHEYALGDELARLAARRAHYADGYVGATVELVTIKSDLVSARAHISFRRRAIVDENNTPLAMTPELPSPTTVVVMVKQHDEHWYLVSIGEA